MGLHEPDSIDPLHWDYDPGRGKTLSDLYRPVRDASKLPETRVPLALGKSLARTRDTLLGDANPPYDALIVDPTKSLEIATRLVDLTGNSLRPAFQGLNWAVMREDLMVSMSDAAREGKHFIDAVRGGSHGDLERCRLLVQCGVRHAMKRHIAEIVQAMAIPYEDSGSREVRERALRDITLHLRGTLRALSRT